MAYSQTNGIFTNKWHIHKPESVFKNETHKIIWDFEIQTDYPIQTSLSFKWQEEKNLHRVNFAVLGDYSGQVKEGKKLYKYMELERKLKKQWNKVTVIVIVIGTFVKVLKILVG